MCLITFSYNPGGKYPLVLLSNRDEEYTRPTIPLHQWYDLPTVIAGRDLEAGGTWLGLNKNGQLATLLNRPFTDWKVTSPKTRGNLVTNYLTSDLIAPVYLKSVSKDRTDYDGFQLVCLDKNGAYYYNNVENVTYKFEPGINAVANTNDDLSNYRVDRSKKLLNDYLITTKEPELNDLIKILQDKSQNPNLENFPAQLSKEVAKNNSAIFIQGEEFGTVASTVIVIERNGHTKIKEFRYNNQTEIIDTTTKEFTMRGFDDE